jgi:sugar phosphate isomerase/epimerase
MEHLTDIGYSRFELLVNPPHLWPADLDAAERAAVRRLMAERGLSLTSLNAPMLDINLVSPAAEVRRYTRQHYRAILELAGEWGAPWLVLIPGKTHPLLPAPAERVRAWFEEALAELDEVAEAAGVRILLENIPMAFLPRAEDLVATLERLGNRRLGVVYDVANGMFAREDPAEGLRVVAPWLELVHLSDTGLDRWDHGAVGTGVVPFGAVSAALDEIGYAGDTVFEIISPRADEGILDSHRALAQLGWGPPPA